MMQKLEPFKEFVVIGVTAVVFILVLKAAASGLPDGGITGAIKRVSLAV